MKKALIFSLILLFGAHGPASAALSKHIVDYRIKAKLIPEEKAVIGHEVLTWLNDSDRPVSELQFHLYLNAFKNNRTTLMKERGGVSRSFRRNEMNWGYQEIRNIRIQNGIDLTSSITTIQPDDGNEHDQTVMQVQLPEPVQPHETIALEIDFYAKLPKYFERSGYCDNIFIVMQWFPKIGVLQDGQWNCHQYHSHSEFFADFGVYEVELNVPEDYVVGATGKKIREKANGDGTVTYTHYQEDIHDFAWSASPDYVEIREPFLLENPHVETEMILLLYREHLRIKDRFLESLKNALTFYSQNYGAYPYPTITLIDPPFVVSGGGAMEYPTLFTTIGAWYMPKGMRLPEVVTIHEFGHSYWYGMVASNEFEEAWLDEGINSYSEIKAAEKFYGTGGNMIDFGPIKLDDFDYNRLQVIASGRIDPILKKSWEFYSGGSYSLNVYSKAALTLLTLERYLGEEIMARIMRTYFERWQFKHPRSEDFIAVVEEVSGQDLGWFFDQFLKSPGKLDYGIGIFRSLEVNEPEGFFNGQFRTLLDDKDVKREKMYKNDVSLVRKGELIFPQEIRIIFENGEEIRETWEGKERWKKFSYVRPYRLKSARLDPENKMVLDINIMNNSAVMNPNKNMPLKYGLSVMLKFQKLLSFISM